MTERYQSEIPTSSPISAKNPRRTRPQSDIDALAARIARNGYESTRAVWAERVNGHVEVFAGGTRLLAARQAGLETLPAFVYEGYDEAEIVRMAEQDNENDEYHRPVPLVDTWLHYKALADAGWTQQRIAQAKGVSQTLVAFRLQLADMPRRVLDAFITNEALTESHAREVARLLQCNNLSLWYSREQAMLDVLQRCLNKTNLTAKIVAAEVERTNAILQLAQTAYDSLDESSRPVFVERLADSTARSQAGVQAVIDALTREIAQERRRAEEELRIATDAAERARIEAERAERALQEREAWWVANVQLLGGDFRERAAEIPDESVDLLFTDPPYDDGAIPLYGDLASIASRILKPGGSLICYVGHYALPDVLPLMTPHLRFWWTLALDQTHQHARLPGKWVFVHWKPLLWFVKGGRRDSRYMGDLIRGVPSDKALHEWQQGIVEARYCIENLTEAGETVCDLMAGSGTTLLAALELGRRAIGCEIDSRHIDTITERLNAHYANNCT